MDFKVLYNESGDIYVIGYEQGRWHKPICILTEGDVEHLSTLICLAKKGDNDAQTTKDV